MKAAAITLLTLACVFGPLMFLFSLWCAYDGFVAYPRSYDQYQTYLTVTQGGQVGDQAWVQYAQVHGLPTEPPRETTRMDIITQYIMLGMTGTLTLICLILGIVSLFLLRKAKRKEASEQASLAQHQAV